MKTQFLAAIVALSLFSCGTGVFAWSGELQLDSSDRGGAVSGMTLECNPDKELAQTCLELEHDIAVAQERERKLERRRKITRFTMAAICFPLYLGFGIAYAPIVGPVAMVRTWEHTFFEDQQ